jgi:PST family polysaccharide transporter
MSNLFKKLSGEKKTVAKNYSALIVLQGFTYLLPLLIIPFLQRRLGLEYFGLVMFAQYLMAFCVAASDFGFNVTATREISVLRSQGADYSKIYFKVFWARTILLVLVFCFLCILVFSVPRFRVEWQMYLLSYGAVVGQTLLPDWFFQGIEKMRLLTIVNVCAKLIFTLILFVFIESASDYLLVPVFNSIGFLISGVVMFVLSLKYVTWQWPDFNDSKEFYKESFQVFISNLASQMSYAANGLILGFFAGNAIVGIYGAFDKLIIAVKKMYIPLYQAIYPFLARKDTAEKIRLVHTLIPIVAAVGALITLGIVFLGPWFIDFYYEDIEISANSYLFQWMGLIAFFTGLSLLFHSLYAPARKLFKQRMSMMLIAGVFNVLFSLIMVSLYGLIGTVIAFITTEAILLILAVYFFTKDVRANA